MTLEEIKNYVNEIVYKEQSGRTMTEEDFNLFIEVVNIELFNKQYDDYVKLSVDRNIKLSQVIKQSLELNEFKVKEEYLTGGGLGYKDLPTDFKYLLSADCILSSVHKPVRITDSGEMDDARYNLLVRSPEDYPLCEVVGEDLYYLPYAIDSISISYLKLPDIPFYDYCIKTSNNKVIYMPVGSYISAGNLYDSGANLIESGVTHPYSRIWFKF